MEIQGNCHEDFLELNLFKSHMIQEEKQALHLLFIEMASH